MDKLQYKGVFKELFAEDKFENGRRSFWGNELISSSFGFAFAANLSFARLQNLDIHNWGANLTRLHYSAVPLRLVAVEPR